MAEDINKHAGKTVISTTAYTHDKKIDLYQEVSKYLQTYCKGKAETCWVVQNFIKKNEYMTEFTHKGVRSKEKYDWLSNLDIDISLKQVSQFTIENKRFKKFHYIGTFAIDFQTYLNEPEYDIFEKYKEGFRNFGMVLNLSRRNQPGTHWVAVAITFNDHTNECEFLYFNSSGRGAPPEVKKFKEHVEGKMKKRKHIFKNYTMKFKVNKITTQWGDSECGVYCINFLKDIAFGKTFEQTTSTIIDDETMNSYRDKFFRKFDGYNISTKHIPGHELGN